MNAEQLDLQIRETLDRIDRDRAECERKRTNPTMAERAERIAGLKADNAGHVLDEVQVAGFKRRIRWYLANVAGALPCAWGVVHSGMSRMAQGSHWWRAHEGTYPCTHEGVLIGFCSPEFATAFEALVAAGYLTVEINPTDVGRHYDDWGIPDAKVRLLPSRAN